jgi:N4-gp56 family major capsid protein
MALQTTGIGGLAPEMKTFYDKVLLTRTVPTLIHTSFAQQRRIPLNGGKIIEFRRFANLATAVTPLTEGTPPSLKDLTVTAITATVAQYGDAVGFSDLVSTTTIDPLLTETTEILADQAATTIDEITREVLVLGTSVRYASTAVSRVTVGAAMILTPAEIRLAVLDLKLGRARRINGFYQAMIHPRTALDLMNTAEWRDAQNYNQTGRVFDGSLGTLYGVKFWESDVAKVYVNAGVGSVVDVFASLFFGADAWGMVSLAGHNLQTYFKPKGSAGTADPIDQQQSLGWKVAFVAKILTDAFMLRLEHSTSTANNVS